MTMGESLTSRHHLTEALDHRRGINLWTPINTICYFTMSNLLFKNTQTQGSGGILVKSPWCPPSKGSVIPGVY